MSKKLTSKKLAQMFKAFCERQSVQYVARKCKIHYSTCRKYRQLNNWDSRLAKIQAKAEQIAGANSAQELADSLSIVRFCKQKLFDQVKAMKTAELSDTPIADLDRLIRLELFLMGQPDSRPDGPDPKEKLSGFSIEQLIIIYNDLVTAGVAGEGRKKIDIPEPLKFTTEETPRDPAA